MWEWCWGGEGARGWAVTHRTRGVGPTSDTCLCTGPWEMHPTLAVKVLPESLQLTQNGEKVPPWWAPHLSVPTGCLECQFGFSRGHSHPSEIQELSVR